MWGTGGEFTRGTTPVHGEGHVGLTLGYSNVTVQGWATLGVSRGLPKPSSER